MQDHILSQQLLHYDQKALYIITSSSSCTAFNKGIHPELVLWTNPLLSRHCCSIPDSYPLYRMMHVFLYHINKDFVAYDYYIKDAQRSMSLQCSTSCLAKYRLSALEKEQVLLITIPASIAQCMKEICRRSYISDKRQQK